LNRSALVKRRYYRHSNYQPEILDVLKRDISEMFGSKTILSLDQANIINNILIEKKIETNYSSPTKEYFIKFINKTKEGKDDETKERLQIYIDTSLNTGNKKGCLTIDEIRKLKTDLKEYDVTLNYNENIPDKNYFVKKIQEKKESLQQDLKVLQKWGSSLNEISP